MKYICVKLLPFLALLSGFRVLRRRCSFLMTFRTLSPLVIGIATHATTCNKRCKTAKHFQTNKGLLTHLKNSQKHKQSRSVTNRKKVELHSCGWVEGTGYTFRSVSETASHIVYICDNACTLTHPKNN